MSLFSALQALFADDRFVEVDMHSTVRPVTLGKKIHELSNLYHCNKRDIWPDWKILGSGVDV